MTTLGDRIAAAKRHPADLSYSEWVALLEDVEKVVDEAAAAADDYRQLIGPPYMGGRGYASRNGDHMRKFTALLAGEPRHGDGCGSDRARPERRSVGAVAEWRELADVVSATILTDRRPVARKPHTCGLCLRLIEPGTRYRYYTCADGGEMWTNHEHDDCAWLVWVEWGCDFYPDPEEVRGALDAGEPS